MMPGDLVVLNRKGKTLRAAHSPKVSNKPSPARMSRNFETSAALNLVLASLEDSKAENIIPIDIRNKSSLGDHMVVASGRSHRHVAAIASQLLQALKDGGLGSARIEGLPAADWVLIDAGDIIVHIFRPEVREFYNIEKMWLTPELDDQTKH